MANGKIKSARVIAIAGPAALSITTQPSSSANSGVAFTQQPVVRVVDINGSAVSVSGISITASIATGSGTLGGSTSVNTNSSGVATFTNLAISGTDSCTLSFSATGLPPVVSNAISVSSTTPDLAFSDFSSGTLSPFTTDGNGGTSAAVVNDPTGSGRGKVVQITYTGSGSIIDANRAVYAPVEVMPTHFFVTFDIYFPAGIFNYTNPAIERKIIYFRDSTQSYRTFVLFIWADQLGYVVETQSDLSSKQRLGIATLTAGAWHSIKAEIQFNTSTSASNGLVRVWLDGTLANEQLNIKLYEGGTPGYGEFMGVGYQREGGTSKDPSDTSANESRYIDNLSYTSFDPG